MEPNQEEDNECEQLIRLQQKIPNCSLMVDGYHSQKKKYYFCPCDPDCQAPLCLSCIQDCHRNHWGKKTLQDLITDKRNALCYCGLRNHILPEGGSASDFIYEEQCLFMEWSITTQTYTYFQNEYDPTDNLCLFCYYLCRDQPENYERISDEEDCRSLKCSCKHEDYLKVFQKLEKLTSTVPFNFENLTLIQFLNMIIMSKKSFENAFHRLLLTLASLENSLLNLPKKDFDFEIFINNSPFMKALENISNLIQICKGMFYSTDIINCQSYIFPLLQRKFNYKSFENIWILKKSLFSIYHKLEFRKDFEVLPILSYKDLSNLNPFQRAMYSEYIQFYPELQERYFVNKSENTNYVDVLLRTIEKYKNIKYKGSHAYEILRIIFSECKKIVRFNKFSYDQCMKFYALNDEIIYNSINNKDIRLSTSISQMKMLSQMVKCILYMAYYYNDNMLNKYLKGEINISQLSFFHSNNETAKMIYKNATHILLYCRTIHQIACMNGNQTQEEDLLMTEKMNQTKAEMKKAQIRATVTKFQYKIMFIATDITALTLNYPDAYLFGLRRLIDKNQEIYQNYLSNILTNKEQVLLNDFRDLCIDIEKVYQKFFEFQIKTEDLEKEIIQKIERFFIAIDRVNFETPFNLDTEKKSSLKLAKPSLLGPNLRKVPIVKMIQQKVSDEVSILQDEKYRILVNKTPLVLTLIKSLKMILGANSNHNLNQNYFDKLFKFLGYYVKDSPDNCLMLLNEKVLKSFLMLDTQKSVIFINLLHYMVGLLVKSDVNLSQNSEMMKVLEELVSRISDKSEYIGSFAKLLKIISKLSKMTYLHQEHTLNKIRKTVKKIYTNNPILKTFKDSLFPTTSINDPEYKSLSVLIKENATIEGYDVEILTILFTKFIKIINYLFDGNSTLNELDFLQTIFTKNQLPIILQDLTLYLPLRIELLKFFRIAYIDAMINPSQVKDYVDIFITDSNGSSDNNTQNFVFFQDLLKVKDKDLDMNIDSSVLNFELKNFAEIVKLGGAGLKKKKIVYYFEEGIILPLHVFINKYISIIYNLDGRQYIKLYEIVLHFLEMKKFILEQNDISKDLENFEPQNIFKALARAKKNQFSLILKKIEKEELKEIVDDIQKLKDKTFEILNYKKLYSFFEKHINGFVQNPASKYLKDVFSKKSTIYSDEEIEDSKKEYKKQGFLSTDYGERIIEAILKYENDKTKFVDSSLSQNLAEKNILYDATYRSIMLRPMFYLINSETLYLKYRHQNLWHIFRLLQYDTGETQEDILQLMANDKEKLKYIKSENIDDAEKENLYKPVVNLEYLSDLFIQNLLSIIFESCNPSATSNNEDYTIAYMIIKIMKYMCEDHNTKFQTIFFSEIKIEHNNGSINMFELLMCVLGKIALLAKWDSVDFDQDENSISYFYEIFFAMIEFAIELIQGTTKENLLRIVNVEGRENEKSYFYKFLESVKGIVTNNSNDSEIIYNVRLDIMNFIAAFVEEKKTPEKILLMLANLYNPLTIFDSIVNILKKLYLKSMNKEDEIRKNDIEFDNEKCEFFIQKYFTVSEFSENQEFELANRMYNYVKQLAKYNFKDAKNIIESINLYTEQQLIEFRSKKKDKNGNEIQNSGAVVMIDPKYCQNYFAVKFFEAITRAVWIQGEEKLPQMVIFTLNPTVLFLSENTKNNFYKTVPRDSRSSKLFALMEYVTYFFIEINHNKKRLAGNFLLKFLNNVNFGLLDFFLFLITAAINIYIFVIIERPDADNDYKRIFDTVFPIALVQGALTFIFLLMWFISKFSLYFIIEREKYYIRMRKNRDESLSIFENIKIIFLYTLFKRNEVVNFLWNLLFSIIGICSSKNLYVFSIQLLIVVNISSTLQNIVKAIVMRYKQLLTSLLFLVVAVYIFSTLAFFLLSKDFVHELEGNQENTCGSLLYCFLTHLEFGLRTDGGIAGFIAQLSFLETPAYFMGMFFYQFIFFIIIIVVMLAVIGGNIIDTFAELREKSQQDLYDMKNVCFICNGTRNEIEKEGESFEDHIEKVHNIWTYVDYMIGLKFVDPQETNAINSFVIEKLEDKKISWFPSFVSKGNDEEGEGDEEEE